jgi:hypothetical protein
MKASRKITNNHNPLKDLSLKVNDLVSLAVRSGNLESFLLSNYKNVSFEI